MIYCSGNIATFFYQLSFVFQKHFHLQIVSRIFILLQPKYFVDFYENIYRSIDRSYGCPSA